MLLNKILRFTFPVREWAILGLFFLLTLVMLYPLSINLTSMVPTSDDPLLNVWRMHWNVHTFLSGPEAIAGLFNANILYPFPLTLAYSEHFLMESALALPILVNADSHLVGLNVSVLIYFTLSAYAMYLLVSDWTRHRWAGLIAGILYAFSPHHFGQLPFLELLTIQWLPLGLLALHWTLTRPGWRYPFLLILFFNIQALSNFHFALNLALACALLTLTYALTRRIYWRRGLWLAGGLAIGTTLLLNWPVWRMYLRFSDVMGAVRTPGTVRIYSAALTDYLTAIPYNWLYGWTFGRWQWPDHQIQPLMPFGLTGLVLALAGLIVLLLSLRKSGRSSILTSRFLAHSDASLADVSHFALPLTIFLLLLIPLFLLFSFGLDELALGPNLAPLLKYSPYFWLYDHVTVFKGIRVPARNSMMVVIGLIGLAGWGAAALTRWMFHLSARRSLSFKGSISLGHLTPQLTAVALTILILLESWSVPLPGVKIQAGAEIPPVYTWLQRETSPETAILELPVSRNNIESVYEYYSSYHWRRLANGATGFTPPIYKDLRQWLTTFPDARSIDVIQQLGLGVVILHPNIYEAAEWQHLWADLPRFLPDVSQIHQIGDELVLRIAKPLCQPDPEQVSSALSTSVELDGLPHAVEVTYRNLGRAAFVANVQQVSRLIFADQRFKNFTEPLVTPAGETQSVLVPLESQQQKEELSRAWLATLDRTITMSETTTVDSAIEPAENNWQPLGLQFTEGPQLAAYSLDEVTPTACSRLSVALKWVGGQPDDTATLQLLDPFGRIVIEQTARPWSGSSQESIDIRTLPLVGSLPAGRYGLRVSVHTGTGQERLPLTRDGVAVPADQLSPLPLVIHPMPVSAPIPSNSNPSILAESVRLTGSQVNQAEVAAGDWLRFTLFWQTDQPLKTDLTVFTQLLGPDGRVWGQWDNQPKGGWYSTSLWLPGQPVSDDYAFRIDPAAPSGDYRLVAGLYNPATGERLPVTAGPGQGQNFIDVATVKVQPP